MMSRLIRWVLGLAAALVLGLLALNLYIMGKPTPKPSIDRPLAQLIPPAPLGWTSTDLPLADTPEGLAQVESILNYDDAVYRLYQNDHIKVGLYIAYWLPGKVGPAKVGAHTPDTCWVNSGWTMSDRQRAVNRNVGGEALKPLEFGVYEKDGAREEVIFWHLVGGVPTRYDLLGWKDGLAGRLERLPTLMQDLANFGLDQRQEQLVVRVSANVPMQELWANPDFVDLLTSLSHQFHLGALTPASQAG